MQIKVPAGERSRVTGRDDVGNALRRPAPAAEVKPCPKENLSLVHRAEEPRPPTVAGFAAKKRGQSPPMIAIERQNRRP